VTYVSVSTRTYITNWPSAPCQCLMLTRPPLFLQLGPIQENVKFLLQLEHTKKTEKSELIIIYLIGIEILLTCIHIFNDAYTLSPVA
jgi:hypothetical protein